MVVVKKKGKLGEKLDELTKRDERQGWKLEWKMRKKNEEE
jgi:hypothetical protein